MSLIYKINPNAGIPLRLRKDGTFHYPTTHNKVSSYMVYNTKTGKYTGSFTQGEQPVKKPKTKTPKAIKSIAKDIIKSTKRSKPRAVSPIVQALIKAREAAGMTRRDVAEAMGKYPNQILVVENGKVEMPTVAMLKAYAKAVGQELVIELKPIEKKAKR